MPRDLTREFGVEALEFEQMVYLLGAPAQPARFPTPRVAMIIRTSKHYDRDTIVSHLLRGSSVEGEAGGHKYLRRQKAGPGPAEEPAVAFLDDHTFLVAMDNWIEEVLTAKDIASPLISSLKSISPSADASFVVINNDFVKTMADEVIREAPNGQMAAFADFPELFRTAKISLRSTPDISVSIALTGKDEAAAARLAEMVKSLQLLGQTFLPRMKAETRQTEDPKRRARPRIKREHRRQT